MEKNYNPEQIERHWYPIWEQSGYFIPSNQGPSYCIMLPPPNVTGTLHMGHGFQVSLMDALIRYHRMQGFDTLWQVGTDHAGIATQMVVERQLLKQNITRQDIGREAFVNRIWEWKNQSDGTIKRQLRRMGASLDWTRERFSMDEDISEAVKEVFVRLYEENLIYRGKRLVNWDPVLLTAVSDLEVLLKEEKGTLWHIRYPLLESNEFIIVATTRPETLLGDTAVAVHPEDERYAHLVGKLIQHPITQRQIPIIADHYVDKEFGSGAVKITPAHDFNDYAIAQRHSLEIMNILTPNAHINQNAPLTYQGLERFEARAQIVEELEKLHLIEKIEPHLLKIPRGDRSGSVIEPYLTDQWYVNAKELAKPAIKAVEENKIQFVPENWKKTYFQWLEDIEDWCISRQLWWGHRIPAWYDENGNVYVAKNEIECRKKYNLDPQLKLRQDEDVLDTWFSAALWPFATLGWPQETAELKTFYPTNVLVTGFDIIFFWVARMIMLGLKFTGIVPFQEVYITGLVRDSEGQKMSKSKGNILDPLDLIDGISLEKLIAKRTSGLMQPEMAKSIEKTTRKEFPNGIPAFGTDALRFTYCALAATGRDVRFDLGRIEGYRNFCNKIWNAARYVLMNCENQDTGILGNNIELSLADRWIRSQLQSTIAKVTDCFANYRFDQLTQIIYEFIWNEYCDWYLELSKPILTSLQSSEEQLRGTRQTLVQVFEALLRLIHPLMPFISEEIWQRIAPLAGKKGPSIMLQPYPHYESLQLDEKANEEIEWLKQMIVSIRNIRGEMNISPAKSLPLVLSKGNITDKQRITQHGNFLQTLARLESIQWNSHEAALGLCATSLVNELELHIPLAELIDKKVEINRLNKEIFKLQKDLEKIEQKLNNKNYIEKAPAEIVERERTKAKEFHMTIGKLCEQCERLKQLGEPVHSQNDA